MRHHRRKVTEEMYTSIPTLIEQGVTKKQIAERFGITPGSLQVMCSNRSISLRPISLNPPTTERARREVRLTLEDDVLLSLRRATRHTGRPSTIQLIGDLLGAIASDNLYSAVLDEEVAA